MKTREKILETALHLFNERGVSQVSSRAISQELGISYGNLTYHFAKKKDIVLALYGRLQKEMEQSLGIIFQKIFEENFTKDTIRILFELTLKYKFIYLNMVELVRQFEEIRETEFLFHESRIKIIRKVMQDLVREGYLKEEEGGFDYTLMGRRLDIIFQFWLINAEIFYRGKEDDKVGFYMELLYNAITPHLTERGLEKFEEFKGTKQDAV